MKACAAPLAVRRGGIGGRECQSGEGGGGNDYKDHPAQHRDSPAAEIVILSRPQRPDVNPAGFGKPWQAPLSAILPGLGSVMIISTAEPTRRADPPGGASIACQ
jgi:hypothetical protein